MSVSFLYPLAWLGAAAIAAPIWLHLRRKEEPDVIHFAALRFLDDQPLARQRPLWLRNWPLLLLRTLVLLLLLSAFAWPYVSNRREAPIRESRVYILDNTLSHQAAGGFEESRTRIVDDLSRNGPETQVAVVELTAAPKVVVRFGDDPRTASDKVRMLEPSFQRGSYLAAFRMANGVLDQSLGERRRIVFLGDHQRNQWSEGIAAPAFLEAVDVELSQVDKPSLPNLAVTAPQAQRVLGGDRAMVECAVRLFRQGDFEDATVVFLANGGEVAREKVQFASGAESVTLSAQWDADPREWLRGEVRLAENSDSLAADNRAVFSLPPIRQGRVALLATSPFLRTAFSPDVLGGRWAIRTLGPSTSIGGERQEPDDDVLCIEGQFLNSPDVRDRILESLNRGNGVLLIIGRQSPPIAEFLRRLGVDMGQDCRQDTGLPAFRYVFMDHPIFQPFRSADFGNLADVRVSQYRRLNVQDASSVAYSADGDPLIVESQTMGGKLLAFAFALDRSETNWPLLPTFVPFLDGCLAYAGPEVATAQTAYVPGETCVWTVPPGQDVQYVVLRDASGQAGGDRVPVARGQARIRVPDRPGHYELRYGEDPAIQSILNVNPPPEESQLTFDASPQALVAWRREATSQRQDAGAKQTALDLSKQEIFRQRIWWWLALGALTGVAVETVWLSLRKEQS